MFPCRLKCAFLCFLLLFAAGCVQAPHTDRSQFIMVSRSQTAAMGQKTAEKIKQEKPISKDPALVGQVRGVGKRISEKSGTDYSWEFNVIDKDTVNAFALPGGNIFVYRGLLEMVDNNAQLATVIAHEIAHVKARHGAERMSMQMGTNLLGQLAQAALDMENPKVARTFQQAYGITSKVGVILPYSRTQEYEADKIGLILMAKAGYKPEAAIAFWGKMMEKNKGKQPPSWLSTHPPSSRRLNKIREAIPEIKSKYYRK